MPLTVYQRLVKLNVTISYSSLIWLLDLGGEFVIIRLFVQVKDNMAQLLKKHIFGQQPAQLFECKICKELPDNGSDLVLLPADRLPDLLPAGDRH